MKVERETSVRIQRKIVYNIKAHQIKFKGDIYAIVMYTEYIKRTGYDTDQLLNFLGVQQL